MESPKVYLASPYGFSEAWSLFYYEKFVPVFQKYGLAVLDPWLTPTTVFKEVKNMPLGEERRAAFAAANRIIGGSNADAIRACDFLVAVLDGADVDSGVAAEVGFAFGLGKPVEGYRGDFRLCGDNEGAVANLQVEHFIRGSGGTISRTLEDLERRIYSKHCAHLF